MRSIASGNLTNQTNAFPEKRGWFLGHFMDNSSLLHSQDIEMKWGVHQKGESFHTVRANKTAKTIAILISGNVSLSFPDENKTILLDQAGDFTMWNAGVFHVVEILEDSTLLTVRWPSVPDDVIQR